MPQRNKRQYIKPGTGTKFRLVNRSIRDLGGYEVGAGANVLAPIDEDLDYDDLDFDQIQLDMPVFDLIDYYHLFLNDLIVIF